MIRARAGLGRAIRRSLGLRLAQHSLFPAHHHHHRLRAPAAAAVPPSLLSLARAPRSSSPTCGIRTAAAAMSSSAAAASDARPGAAGAPVAVRDAVVLTDQEEALFATLLQAARAAGTGTVLRAAGGWVRDKLLGRASVDIDIALDNMYGKDFAEKVNEYLASQGVATHSAAVIQSNPDQSKHLETARIKVPVLPTQPPTQQQRAAGGGNGTSAAAAAEAPAPPALWIDLVNLRSETYAEGSRIPTMEFGTPQQDAERRDFTINALFYNINESRVEDLTGKGVSDLRAGVIRTPLPARTTFADDPLRALRAVRFGTRLGFALDADIVDAAASDQIRTALGTKVSRERIGAELDGMLLGPAPAEAVETLARLRLFPAVFAAPPDVAARLPEAEYAAAGARCCAAAEAIERADAAARLQQEGEGQGQGQGAPSSSSPGLLLTKEERRLLLLAATLLPLRGAETTGGGGGGGGGRGGGGGSAARPQPAAAAVVRASLKWRAKDADGVAMLHEAAPELAAIHARLVRGGGGGALGTAGATTDAEGEEEEEEEGAAAGGGAAAPSPSFGVRGAATQEEEDDVKVALGRVIRRLKEQWRLAALLVPLLPLPEARPLAVEGAAAASGSQASDAGASAAAASAPGAALSGVAAAGAAEAAAAARLAVARDLEAAARAWRLDNCHRWRPLLDGKAAMAALGMSKQGPALGRALGAALEWQYAHPSGTAAQCASWLAGAYDAEGNPKKKGG